MKNKSNYQGYGMPERLTLAYRRIPPRVRSIWSMGSSSSELALGAIRDSHRGAKHWGAFGAHMAGIKFLPSYVVGAGIRNTGLAALAGSVLGLGLEKQSTWLGPVTGLNAPSLGWREDYGRSSVIDRGWLASSMGMENKELPDWFPTTHIGASWFEVVPARLLAVLAIGFAGGLAGPGIVKPENKWGAGDFPATSMGQPNPSQWLPFGPQGIIPPPGASW